MLHLALLIPFLAPATPVVITAQEASDRSFAEEQRIEDAEVQRLREEMLVRLLQPRPLSGEALAAIPDELGFDGEARAEWAAQCERYQSRWLEDVAELSARSRRLRLAAYEWNDANQRFEPRPVEQLILLNENTMKVREELEEMEEDLLEELPSLSSSERISHARAIVYRRFLERTWRPTRIKGSHVDITRLLENLELSNDDMERLESIQEKYRNEFGESVSEHASLFDENAFRTASDLIELGPFPSHAYEAEFLDGVRQSEEERATELLSQELELRMINQEYLGKLVLLLPAEQGHDLAAAWSRLVGGNMLAEHERLARLATSAAMNTTLEKDVREALLLVPIEVQERNAKLDNRIIKQEALADALLQAAPSRERDLEISQVRAELLRMQVKRRETMVTATRTLIGILGSEVPAATEQLLEFQATLASMSDADIQLARRLDQRASESEAMIAWEWEERLLLESLQNETVTDVRERSEETAE